MLKFKVNKTAVAALLAAVQSVVESRATIPLLSNLLVESVGREAIKITGTDLDVTLAGKIEAEVSEEGSVSLPAKKFNDICRLASGDTISLAVTENFWTEIAAGKSKYRIAGIDGENFPEIQAPGNADFLKIDSDLIKTFIKRTVFAVTQEQSRFTLSGAKLEVKNGLMRMIATDGHRLTLCSQKTDFPKDIDVLIPKKALNEILKITGGQKSIEFFDKDSNIFVRSGNFELSSRKLSGTFPNWEMVLPSSTEKSCEFDLDEVRRVLRRVVLMSDGIQRSVKLTVRSGEIEFYSISAEEGEGSETVSAVFSDNEEVSLKFNHLYLSDMLNALSNTTQDEDKSSSGVKLKLNFNDGNSASVIKIGGEEDNFSYVIMPLRM